MSRRICFVTGTRAEFGLMGRTLRAVEARDDLSLQIVATGMHLSDAHGRTVDDLRRDGWRVDRVVDWPSAATPAAATGAAMAGLAGAYAELSPDVVLVVGDRVEAFAAAAAAHLDNRVVAHVHGGDRAQGQADDALRHAITKLAHLHFAATAESAGRVARLGEDAWRIHAVGAPGIDGIAELAAPSADLTRAFGVDPGGFALLVYHPTRADPAAEHATAGLLLDSTLASGVPRVVVVYPNNDPGHEGIIARWEAAGADPRVVARRDLPRQAFLGLLRDAAFLVGNSSSGIIEAASFGTPVLDVGPRQRGRERSGNVTHVQDPLTNPTPLRQAVARAWNSGSPSRWAGGNVYGGAGTADRIADVLATAELDARLRRKLIAY